MNKRLKQRHHAIKRCLQRYEIELTLKDYTDLCDRIYSYGRYFYNKYKVNRLGIEEVKDLKYPTYFIFYHRELFLVRWDNRTCQITTFLSRTSLIEDRDYIMKMRNTPMHLRWTLKSKIGVATYKRIC